MKNATHVPSSVSHPGNLDDLSLTFHVVGIPRPKGSWAPIVTRGGKVALRASAKGEGSWSDTCGWHAKAARVQQRWTIAPRPCAVVVDVDFVLPRPASPSYDFPVGDLDKLLRSALDAFTGIVYVDDVQVAKASISKRYTHVGEEPGASFTIRRLRS